MERIRVGVVGCGEIAQIMHLPFLTELRDHFEVRAVCDISRGLVDAVGERFGVPHRLTRYQELVARPDIDAVAVLTADHAPVALAAAEAGKHILVEKPMCFTLEEGRAMIAAAERRGVTLMVGYMKRYDPGYEYGQALLRGMEGVQIIRIHDFTGRGPLAPRHIYSLEGAPDIAHEERARLQADLGARLAEGVGSADPVAAQAYGMMLGLSSHDMTVLRGAFGDPSAVRYAEILAGGSIVMAVLEYPGGARCVWEIGNMPGATHTIFDEELVAYGRDRTVSVRFPNPYVRYAPTTVHVREMDGAAQAERTVTASNDEAFRREWLHFHHCVTTGAAPRTGGADALRDVELLRAIVRSALDGAPVALG
jgi:predicted dehydrogenase